MIAYQGNEPFVFISYAHKDKNLVLPIIQGLQNRGFRVWYDQGVEVGDEWPDFIAEHMESCCGMVAFVSRNFGESNNCREELSFAKELDKTILVIYLEDRKNLRAGVRMRLSTLHYMNLGDYADRELFINELAKAKALKPCLGPIAAPVSAPAKSSKPNAEKRGEQTAAVERKIGLVNKTISGLAAQKYGRGTAAATPTKPVQPNAEELYNQANVLNKNQEYVNAYLLYKKAAEMGYAPAQNSLGYCYQYGEGVAWDKKEAVKWYSKAADQGDAAAQYNLGLCYEKGWGVDMINKAEAAKWYLKAAKQGHEKAIKATKTLK